MIDFPAAHSMDTGWFCVDEDGQIARFTTGEDGPVFIGASVGMDEVHAALEKIADTLPTEVVEDDEDGEGPIFEFDFSYRPEIYGVYNYGYGGWGALIEPYERGEAPKNPLTLDKLPPEVQKMLAEGRLKEVRFARDEAIQFVEHGDVMPWGEAAAWLDTDRKHVRPMPGEAQAYANYHAAVHKDGDPGDDFVYETPTLPPKVPPLKSGGQQSSRMGGGGWAFFLMMIAIAAGIGLALWLRKGG